MPKKTIEQLVESFAVNVAAQNEAIMEGNSRKSNKHANQLLAAFDALCEMGSGGREALSILLQHPRPDVRATSACFLLRYKTEEALTVLEEVSKMPGLAGFEAGECIKRWQEGTWQLDPDV
ncbi:MAG: DUF2019 domain-containing protein [Armatimonadetes bacterium]|nr:DUF2019 domain-containing protein [Armatimonadota bacterium]